MASKVTRRASWERAFASSSCDESTHRRSVKREGRGLSTGTVSVTGRWRLRLGLGRNGRCQRPASHHTDHHGIRGTDRDINGAGGQRSRHPSLGILFTGGACTDVRNFKNPVMARGGRINFPPTEAVSAGARCKPELHNHHIWRL